MKCDELETEQWLDYGGEPMPCYPAKNVDEAIAELKAENERLKALMPRYKKFEEHEKFLKTLVDEYEGYVYDWKGKAFIATPYINIFIKGILRAMWLARAERAVAEQTIDEWSRYRQKHPCGSWRVDPFEYWVQAWIHVEKLCRKKAEEYK